MLAKRTGRERDSIQALARRGTGTKGGKTSVRGIWLGGLAKVIEWRGTKRGKTRDRDGVYKREKGIWLGGLGRVTEWRGTGIR